MKKMKFKAALKTAKDAFELLSGKWEEDYYFHIQREKIAFEEEIWEEIKDILGIEECDYRSENEKIHIKEISNVRGNNVDMILEYVYLSDYGNMSKECFDVTFNRKKRNLRSKVFNNLDEFLHQLKEKHQILTEKKHIKFVCSNTFASNFDRDCCPDKVSILTEDKNIIGAEIIKVKLYFDDLEYITYYYPKELIKYFEDDKELEDFIIQLKIDKLTKLKEERGNK